MHLESRFLNWCRTVLLAAVIAGLAACQSRPSAPQGGGEDDFESEITITPDQPSPAHGGGRRPVEPPADRLTQHARSYADGLAAKLRRAETIRHRARPPEHPDPPALSQSVIWLNPESEPRADRFVSGPASPDQQARRKTVAPTPAPSHRPPASSPRPADKTPIAKRDHKTLIQELAKQIRENSDPPTRQATALANLSALNGTDFNASGLKGLTPDQRRRIEHYHKFLVALQDKVESGDGKLDGKAIAALYDPAGQVRDVVIRTIRLVRRVESYGVYDEINDNRLMAGRENPVILYLELDHFRAEKTADGRYQVRLAQEVELYTRDGVVIWQQPREEIVDRSYNLRRDFFVTQHLRLPANLGVGEFVLKVRVTDLQGGTLDERSRPVVLVADQRLVSEK